MRRVLAGLWAFIRGSNKLLILLCAVSSAYGVLLVYSAAHSAGFSKSGVVMQIGASVAGLLLALIISSIDYEAICSIWPVYVVGSLILMILTFTPLGLNVAGTDDTAWIGIPPGSDDPFLTIQPSELMKIVFIITFSKHLAYVREHVSRPLTVLGLCAHGLFPAVLVFLQGDDGTALVFLCIFASMMLVSGLKALYFLAAGTGIAAMIPVVWNHLDQQKTDRILALIYPEQYLATTGWQQDHALTAIGSGQLWGVGYLEGGGHGLYARNNDFIFTVAGEEFGFIGAFALFLLIILIVVAMLIGALRARDRLGMFLCTGMMALIGFQSLINLGMNLRVLPVIGITLPLFSAGGSSVFTLYLGIGLALSVCYAGHREIGTTLFTKKL